MTYFTGQNCPPKKWANWVSQSMGCLLTYVSDWVSLQNDLFLSLYGHCVQVFVQLNTLYASGNIDRLLIGRCTRRWVCLWVFEFWDRLPDLVDGLIFYPRSFFLVFFCLFVLPSSLWAHWTELIQTLLHVAKWLRFENTCPKCGVLFP